MIRIFYIHLIIFTLILSLVKPSISLAQSIDLKVKANLVLDICKYIDFKEKISTKEIKIGVVGDNEFYKEIQTLSKSLQIDKKPVVVSLFETIDEISNIKVLFISNDFNDKLSEIFFKLKTAKVLLITDKSLTRSFSMINILPKGSGAEKFEINKQNSDLENITYNSKIFSIGGVVIEEQELAKEAQSVIQTLSEQLVISQTNLERQKRDYNKKNEELNSLRQNTRKLEERTSNQQRKMYNQTEEIFMMDEEAKKLQDTLQRKIAVLNQQKEEIKKQEEVIILKQRDIKKYFKFLDGQKKQMVRQQKLIDQQKSTLNDQNILIKTQKDFLKLVLLFIFLITGFSIFIYRSYREKKKTNIRLSEKNAEILMQKEEIEAQRDELEEKSDYLRDAYTTIEAKNLKITDSIKYAKRIQHTIMPQESYIRSLLPDAFVLIKPKDIVSGDFYWFEEKEDLILFAAVDCTGHGVPGALMSMVANDLLKQAVNNQKLTKPGDILNYLNLSLSNSINRRGDDSSLRDGMDLALCSLDRKNLKLQYAGVHNPLFIFRKLDVKAGEKDDYQLIIYKADKYSIGSFTKKSVFAYTNHEVQLQSGDTLFIFSDGFVDQLGGSDSRKFMIKRFRETLLSIQQFDMETQKEKLLTIFELWRGNKSQIDDVLVIGIRV